MKKGRERLLIAYLCVLLLLFTFIPSILNAAIPEIVLKQKKAVATIFINDKDGHAVFTASGFIIDESGVIATNYHVVSYWLEFPGSTILLKMENGALFPVQDIISLDQDNDIALIKVDGKGLTAVKLATGYRPKQGESVVVIGSPLGLETTVSAGIISGVRAGGLLQITAPISPGSSGSAVLNLKGETIGIATFIIEGGQNLNFAVPASHIGSLLTEYKKLKKNTTSPRTLHSVPFNDLLEMKAHSPNPNQVNELEKAKSEVQKNPNNAESYISLSWVYYLCGMYMDAIEAAKQAIRLKPDDAQAHFRLGIAYLRLRLYKEAHGAFKQGVRIEPDNWLILFLLGATYIELGMNTAAVESFKEAKRLIKERIRLDPENMYAHLCLGFISLGIDDRDSAFEEYKILKDLDPQKANLLFNSIYK